MMVAVRIWKILDMAGFLLATKHGDLAKSNSQSLNLTNALKRNLA